MKSWRRGAKERVKKWAARQRGIVDDVDKVGEVEWKLVEINGERIELMIL